jgi:hypothetical protein
VSTVRIEVTPSQFSQTCTLTMVGIPPQGHIAFPPQMSFLIRETDYRVLRARSTLLDGSMPRG